MSDTLASPPPLKVRWSFGLAAVLLIFVVIATYSSRMAENTTGTDYQRALERKAILEKLRAEDEKALTTADWIDQSKGTVRIPIDEAMPETVAALQAKPVQMGAAIPGAVPAGAPPAPPATNAPAATPTPPNK